MKRICVMACAMAALALPALAQDDGPWGGPWETNQGRLHLEQNGDRARGDYDLNEGRVRGGVEGNIFRGQWAQSTARERCFEERMGTFYWGRFHLRLSDDGRYFQGRWWYCDGDPGNGGEWTGHRPHRWH